MPGPPAHPAAPPYPWVTRGCVWAPGQGRGHHNAPWQAASTRQFACKAGVFYSPPAAGAISITADFTPKLVRLRSNWTSYVMLLQWGAQHWPPSSPLAWVVRAGAPECQFPRCAAETESHESQRLRVIDWPRPCDTFVRMIRPARSRTRNASSTVRPTTRSIRWCNPNLSSGKRPTCRPDLQSHGSSTSAGASVLAGLPHLCRTCRVQRRRDLSAGQCWPRDEAQLRFANNRLAAPESRA